MQTKNKYLRIMSKTKRWIENQMERGGYIPPNFCDYIHSVEYQQELEVYEEKELHTKNKKDK
jgi:hypothetical protein